MIDVSPAGRAMIDKAVTLLIQTQGAGALGDVLAKLPAGDRDRLLAAPPRDVFITAMRIWRQAAPPGKRIARAAAVALIVLQAGKIYPAIARAQRELEP